MKPFYPGLSALLKRLLVLIVIYQLSRLAFLVSNFQNFSSRSFAEISSAFLAGLRFDFAAIMMINLPYAILQVIPLPFLSRKSSQKALKYLFFITNIPFILLNCVDLEYFKYQGKRTTADLFQLFGMGEDMRNTLPQMAMDFWYVLVIFIVLSTLLIITYDRISKPVGKVVAHRKSFLWLKTLVLTGLFVIGARGGLQYKPLGIMAAARITSPQLVPLVLNTPFTVIRTFGKPLTEEKHYMSEEQALTFFNKDHHYYHPDSFRPMNVVIIILESFSAEYIGALNKGDGYTPFLDSLMGESMTFTNAFANAKKSIDGIPAVLASIPTLMPASYISSPYNGNRLHSIAAMLAHKGYSSAFFHGGNNGTMNFDNFTMISGFEKYYGRKEYPGTEYDGQWGIYDENFYYFFIDKCNEMKKPFVNAFFSLSSHHPYSIPEHLKGKFKKGPLPIHESIGYADYALSRFFEKASHTSWYQNTLFIITADHTGPADKMYYTTKTGMFRIPIVFFHPGAEGLQLRGWSDRVTEQTDIVPGILDYLRFDEPFTAFGNSMFDTTVTPFAINYTGDVYQAIGSKYLVQFDGTEMVGAFKYKTDSLLMQNVASPADNEQTQLLNILKSLYQQFSTSLIHNELTPAVNERK